MKILIGTILASLIVIAIASAAPVQAQFPGQNFPGQRFPGQNFPGQRFPVAAPNFPGFPNQQFQNYGPFAGRGIPTLPLAGQSLFQSADTYLRAVEHFAEEASRVRTVDRFTIRLIGRLEDQAASMRHTSRHPDDVQRLIYEFDEIEALQPRIESSVFGSGCPIARAALGECWNEVQVAFVLLSNSIQQQVQVSAYSSAFGSHPGCGPAIDFRAAVQPGVPVVPRFPARQFPARQRGDLGSAILGGILSRVVQGL